MGKGEKVLLLEVCKLNAGNFLTLKTESKLHQITYIEFKPSVEQKEQKISKNDWTKIGNLHRLVLLNIGILSNLNEHVDNVGASADKKVKRNDQDVQKDNTIGLRTVIRAHAIPGIESKSVLKQNKPQIFTGRANRGIVHRPIPPNNGTHSISNVRFDDDNVSPGKNVTKNEEKEMQHDRIAEQGILPRPRQISEFESKPFIKPNAQNVMTVWATPGHAHRIALRNVGVHSVLNERLDEDETGVGKNETRDEEEEIQKARITVISSCSFTLLSTAIFITYVYFRLKSKRLTKVGVIEPSSDRTSILR